MKIPGHIDDITKDASLSLRNISSEETGLSFRKRFQKQARPGGDYQTSMFLDEERNLAIHVSRCADTDVNVEKNVTE